MLDRSPRPISGGRGYDHETLERVSFLGAIDLADSAPRNSHAGANPERRPGA
jgi:hypothetical protein